MKVLLRKNQISRLFENSQLAKSLVEKEKLTKEEYDDIASKLLPLLKSYIGWVARELSKREDVSLAHLIDQVKVYDKIIKKEHPDIYKFSHIEVENLIKERGTKSKREEKKEGAVKVYEDELIVIFNILSRRACLTYGANTKWCITSRDNPEWWETYYCEAVNFYFVINKTTDVKVAVAVYPSGELKVFDQLDQLIPLPSKLNKLKNHLKPLGIEEVLKRSGTDLIPSSTYPGRFDVYGNVYLSQMNLKKIPIPFGLVTGSFSVDHNKLTSLINSPIKVEKSFYCKKNNLKSLQHAPSYVGINFDCSWNQLESLKGCPAILHGSFNCNHNEGLKNLIGGPSYVGSNYYCGVTRVSSLKGLPQRIGGNLTIPREREEELKGMIERKEITIIGEVTLVAS